MAVATAPRTATLKSLTSYIPCARCGAHEYPGLAAVLPTGQVVCRLCRDTYETADLTSQDFAEEAC